MTWQYSRRWHHQSLLFYWHESWSCSTGCWVKLFLCLCPAKARSISLPLELEAQINNVLSSSALNSQSRSNPNAKSLSRSTRPMAPSNPWDYKNIIEKLQVRRSPARSTRWRRCSATTTPNFSSFSVNLTELEPLLVGVRQRWKRVWRSRGLFWRQEECVWRSETSNGSQDQMFSDKITIFYFGNLDFRPQILVLQQKRLK